MAYDDFDNWGKDYEFNKSEDDNYFGGGLPDGYYEDEGAPDYEGDDVDWDYGLSDTEYFDVLEQIADQVEAGNKSGKVEEFNWYIKMSYKNMDVNPLRYPLDDLSTMDNNEDYDYILSSISKDIREGSYGNRKVVTLNGTNVYYAVDLYIYRD